MEEQYAADRENFNPETINAVKTSLMGPLSGVGDSFFQGTVRLIAFGLGISLAQQGSVLGPILAMIISIVPSVLVTWFAGKLGYTMGSKYLTKLNGGMMDKLMYVCLGSTAANKGHVLHVVLCHDVCHDGLDVCQIDVIHNAILQIIFLLFESQITGVRISM